MWMRSWIVIEVVAGLAGCTVAARTGDGMASLTTDLCVKPNVCPGGGTHCGVEELSCPDGTTNCCSTNGTGVYTAEGGFAGIDIDPSPPVGQPPYVARKVMITHFVNAGGHVGFQAGAFDRDSHWSVVGDGQVSSADYGTQQGLGVVAVHETATLPSWTLADPTGAPITVTGDALATLRLHLSVPDGWGHLVPALVDFTGSVGGVPGVHAYAMRWRLDAPDTAWRPYCLDGLRQPDAAVFQQDIAVGPVAGEVTQPPAGTTVTLSCLRGAPATVYGWHYPYTGASLFYFGAGIQMKRASYCADERYYTTSGTAIELADDQHIQRGTAGSDHVRYLEAGWTAAGATCVDLANLRHSAMGFTGSCAGHALPSCPADPTSTPYLIAGPQAPAP